MTITLNPESLEKAARWMGENNPKCDYSFEAAEGLWMDFASAAITAYLEAEAAAGRRMISQAPHMGLYLADDATT